MNHIYQHLQHQGLMPGVDFDKDKVVINMQPVSYKKDVVVNLEDKDNRKFYFDWAGDPEITLPRPRHMISIDRAEPVFLKLFREGKFEACQDFINQGFDLNKDSQRSLRLLSIAIYKFQ